MWSRLVLSVAVSVLIGCSAGPVSSTAPPPVTPTSSATSAASATGSAPPADLPAEWNFVCGGNSIPHQLDTLVVNADGTFTGTGHFMIEPAYTWDLSGTVDGGAVNWAITYTGLEAGFVYSGTGTVSADGSLAGDVAPNVNDCTTISTGSGLFSPGPRD